MPPLAEPVVFYHELGHFVAHEMNQAHFNGPAVTHLRLFPRWERNRKGEVTIGDPEYYNPDQTMMPTRMSLYLASLAYGCIFEAYYLHVHINKLFYKNGLTRFLDCYDYNGSGEGDVTCQGRLLDYNGLSIHRMAVTKVESLHFEHLVNEKALSSFMLPNPERYFSDNATMEADLPRLRIDLSGAVRQYSTHYLSFVADLEHCLQQDPEE